jgi:hypothetical protein
VQSDDGVVCHNQALNPLSLSDSTRLGKICYVVRQTLSEEDNQPLAEALID